MIYSYRRVSTDEQHNGPIAQLESIASWHQRRKESLGIPETEPLPMFPFCDNGVSGSVPLYDRPMGGKMCAALKDGDTVVASKLDRLFRSVADAASVIDDWTRRNIKLVAIAEGFDMTNPYGRAMAQMASVFAELERAMIRQRTLDAMASKKKRGECVGEVPYGWDKVNGKLVRNEREQTHIETMRHMNYCKWPIQQICSMFNQNQIPTKKGGKWGKTQVRRVLERAAKSQIT